MLPAYLVYYSVLQKYVILYKIPNLHEQHVPAVFHAKRIAQKQSSQSLNQANHGSDNDLRHGEIDQKSLRRWLKKAKTDIWDFKNIRGGGE
jgi:hypothetical protein